MKQSKNETGKSVSPDLTKQNWAQTETQVHDAWCEMGIENPMASALLHKLVSLCDKENAVGASLETLSTATKISVSSVKRALIKLEKDNWIQIAKYGKTGRIFILNSRVCWKTGRDKLSTAKFTATIYCDSTDQDEIDNSRKLRIIPQLIVNQPE